ncbi:phospholipase D-like domain-containing protein [Mycobacterium sp. SMC-4]|uniref:phospholipase D-like domain-containing protein n=1 Tax=Mycobacterium sp. SMC-4 TaxID=2857059 RepID=UPI003CFD28BB
MGEGRLLVAGQTCWRTATADRLAVIVDAADYFHHVKAAMLRARRRIILVGWDFDYRMTFERDGKTLAGPNQLGAFLRWLVRRRSGLEICMLKSNLGLLPTFQTIWRGVLPVSLLNRVSSERMQFAVDGAHPTGAVHHQKIVVVDDAVAFCGGIDLTVERWDTPDHPDDSTFRRIGDEHYGPRHEVAVAVDGAAARTLSELARNRWRAATGQFLAPVAAAGNLWPRSLEPTLSAVDVAIARTLPALPPTHEAREVEALNFAAIGAARDVLYLENQYLASRSLAEALAARLREPDGPEIVVVLPRSSESPLERTAMDTARYEMLRLLWAADEHARFAAFWPVTDGGTPIYVHSKVLVADQRLLRIGSSNLNNRSLGFDSECDLAVEADPLDPDDEQLRRTIAAVRDRLLAEHLGVPVGEFVAAVSREGSFLAAIQALAGHGRTLRPFTADTIAGEAGPLAENDLMDPDRVPESLSRSVQRLLTGLANRPPWNGYAVTMSPQDRAPETEPDTTDAQTDVPPANPAYATPPPEGIPDAEG